MSNIFPLDPPPGFSSLDLDKKITFYRRHLPHWRQKGASYFVTIRLNDSLPQNKITELKLSVEKKRHELTSKKSKSELSENKKQEILAKLTFDLTERWLDQGMGSCVLGNAKKRDILSETLSRLNDEQYELDAYVIMPNHVHFIIRPLHGYELTKIFQTLKRISSFKINEILQKQGALWQGESYDRIIRDSQHLWRCLQYIGGNPGKAKLQKDEFTRWINPTWPPLGWNYRNE